MNRANPVVALTLAAGCLASTALMAQEIAPNYYSRPIGVTQNEMLRVIIAPAPLRFQGPASLCQARVTLELLDALTMSVLSTLGPSTVSIGDSLQSDFMVPIDPPPARRELVVRATIVRTPTRPAEEEVLSRVCPLLGSVQTVDVQTGRTSSVVFDNDFIPAGGAIGDW